MILNIALDYDETYTKDPAFWQGFLALAEEYGHTVHIVTARHPELDRIPHELAVEVHYCNGVAKKFATHHNFEFDVDIWIDDKPHSITENSPATREWLKEWRANRV